MEAKNADDSTCPFCPFFDPDSNFVTQHVQYCHPENESSAEPQELFQAASRAGLESQLSTSSELGVGDDCGSLRPIHAKPGDPAVSRHASFSQAVETTSLLIASNNGQVEHRISTKKLPNGSIKKLGRAELGPYAHEKKMPSWLFRMLDKETATVKFNKIASDGKLSRHVIIANETPNIVSALAQLCGQDKSVQRAFLCSPHVHHISKMPREGGFCGYRNIQMLVSYIRGSDARNLFPSLPTILELQDMIERAWDMGYNAIGRTETGGIKGTRKYIGTSEAQAFFLSLGIQCEAQSIGKTKEMSAHSSLLSHIAAYFKMGLNEQTEKVVLTDLPPIYFQHHGSASPVTSGVKLTRIGHSMTIVGFEIREQGSGNLLVLDPGVKTPSVIKHAMTANIKTTDPARAITSQVPARDLNYAKRTLCMELIDCSYMYSRTPGVGKTVHCEQLAQDTGLRHLSINRIAKDRGCYDTYDEELKTWVVDEDKLLDAIEDEVLQGGFLIDWHACDLFPKSWIDLVVVLRCPSTSTLYDRLNSRGYHETKLQENLDAEIFGVLIEEAREGFDEEIVVELSSEEDGDVEANCARIASWIENWKTDQSGR
ncbi:uncharacterized protein DSM5745_10593 [Aspergillus mulundensis]|uniref:Adenylate kinase isoenzyme 6 homolog n=1 Tax=Aspergillus mulundensis TaxID=1810919 RepID=A0A3D8QJM8_9EURO|nr:hypothetical protein DSM5745_10593 [Aspergillus mulundensis]RDW61921.1 hypothetical protein DSM5745_10593 [Aspergillus mulundensis]